LEGKRINYLYFWSIVILAILLRIFYLVDADCIEIDGAEYARLSENLLAGKGYTGLSGTPHMGLSPLYPILIAGLAFVIKNIELSGRIISLIFGTFTLFPVYLLVRRIFNRKAALLAILFLAIYPPMVLSSTAVLSEASYTFLFVWALYFMYRILESPQIKWAVLMGLSLSLAYLIRPEAYLFLGLTVLIIIIITLLKKFGVTHSIISILLIIIIYVICALPQAFFIYRHTGHFSLEGKSSIGLIHAVRVGQGQSYHQSMYGLQDDLEPYGLLINTGWTIGEKVTLMKVLKENPRALIRCWARNFVNLRKWVLDRVFKPIVWIIIAAGFILSIKQKKDLLGLLYFLIPCFLIFGIYVSYQHQFRYYIPTVPLVIISLSFCILKISDYLSLFNKSDKSGRTTSVAVTVILFIVVCLFSWPIYKNSYTYKEAENLEAKRAGQYILADLGPGRKMMCSHTPAAYYAQAIYIPTPYAKWEAVKKYAFLQKVDIFGVDSSSITSRDLISDTILKDGIVSREIQLIKVFRNDMGHEFQIYKLNYEN